MAATRSPASVAVSSTPDPPLCACHGERKRWNKDPRYKAGGFWKCRVGDLDQKRAAYANNPEVRLDRQLRNLTRIRVIN